MDTNTVLALAFGLGVIAGLRALTAPAVVCWAAHWKWLNLDLSPLSFMGTTIAAIIFAVLAVAELVNDKLPKTPSRKAPPSFVIRIVMGALSGAALCSAAGDSLPLGAALGAVGAVAGTFGGCEARIKLVKALKLPDLTIALLEDAIAVGGAFFLVSRFV
jgi:uncharacterized membrane protein